MLSSSLLPFRAADDSRGNGRTREEAQSHRRSLESFSHAWSEIGSLYCISLYCMFIAAHL